MPYADVKGKRLFYQEKGEGFPIVFSHSYLWDNKMWQPQIDVLSKQYRCISVDLWSHGQSDIYPHKNYSIEHCAEDHWDFTQALGLNEFAFFGLSVGGMIGAHLAVQHPEAVKVLAMLGTFVGPELEEQKAGYAALLGRLEQEHFSNDLIQTVTPFFFSPVTLEKNLEFVKEFQQDLSEMPGESMSSIAELGRAILLRRNSLLDRLPELSMPTLVMVGKDDVARPPHESETMADLIPNATLEVIEDAGHVCSLEKPEFVSEQLLVLLERK